jgi:hypothetical protein
MSVGLTLAFGGLLLVGMRETARSEVTLAAEGARAVRVVSYELAPARQLRVPIDPETDVCRIVAHALKRGSLTPGVRLAHLMVSIRGTKMTRTEELTIPTSGDTERVTPEDPGIAVGDPVGTNIDVHGAGGGALTVALLSLDGADALLVRVYRRESLGRSDVARRIARIDDARREHLARHAGEMDWLDLDDEEQTTLAAAQWKKVGALSDGEGDLRSRAIALAPPRRGPPSASGDELIGAYELRYGERVAIIAQGPNTILAHDVAGPAGHVVAVVRGQDGTAQTVEGDGEARVDVPDGRALGIELGADEGRTLVLRASDATLVESASRVAYWRTTSEQPVVVTASSRQLVLLVTTRRPVPRSLAEPVAIALGVSITSPTASTSTTLTATVERSAYDRYEDDREQAPSERAVFYVLVPPGGTTTLQPREGALDLSLAELDPREPARLASMDPFLPPTPRVVELGGREWEGFARRRPTNAEAFAPDMRGYLQVARRFEPISPANPEQRLFRAERPKVPGAIFLHNSVFEPANVEIPIDVAGRLPVIVPLRLYARQPVDVVAEVDGGEPRRIPMGTASLITTARTTSVEGEVPMALPLGDDLAPGGHLLTFRTPPGSDVWVHLPWLYQPTTSRYGEAHWIAGDFEP